LPNSEVRNSDTFGVLKLTLHPFGYDWAFVPVAGKTFTDSGSNMCHGAPPTQPPNPTLFSDGFESGDFSAWTSKTTGGDGTATVQSTTVHAGTYAARLKATAAAGSNSYARKSLAQTQTDLTASGWFRVAAEGAASGNVPLLRLYDSSGTRLASLYRQNQSSDRLYVQHSGTYNLTSGKLPLGAWGRLQLHVVTAGSASTVEVLLNGSQIYKTTAANLGSSGVATVQIGNDTKSQAFDLAADEITVTVPG
jgi:hypothetical protein